MKFTKIIKLTIAHLAVLTMVGCAIADDTTQVLQGDYKIVVTDEVVSPFDGRNLLGTHSLWWGTQKDLVSPKTHEIYPSVLSFFNQTKSAIRYGGGSNEAPLQICIGRLSDRPLTKIVDWAGPMQCQFGVDEYLSLLQTTGGKEAWMIANIAGENHKLFSFNEMNRLASSSSSYLKAAGANFERYWELGNELERGSYGWNPEMISERASVAAKAIALEDPDARLILPLIEFDAPNQPPRKQFNEKVLRGMKQPVHGIALHLYYDGVPGGPSIATQIRTVVETAALYKRLTGQTGEVWVTEHGRWPEGDGRDKSWPSRWYQTNDLYGVLATADFIIALAQVTDVKGAMVHGLRAGPWNVFEKTASEPRLSGIGRLFKLFSEVGHETRLRTQTVSSNQSGYKGGYDIRATAFASSDRQAISFWIVNRATTPVSIDLSLPTHTDKIKLKYGSSITCPVSQGKCTGDQFKYLQVNESQLKSIGNDYKLTLPAQSVTAIELSQPH